VLTESSASRMEIWPSRVTDSEQPQLSPKELQTFRGSLCTLPSRRARLMGISSLYGVKTMNRKLRVAVVSTCLVRTGTFALATVPVAVFPTQSSSEPFL
jgi:hypothetical protein